VDSYTHVAFMPGVRTFSSHWKQGWGWTPQSIWTLGRFSLPNTCRLFL